MHVFSAVENKSQREENRGGQFVYSKMRFFRRFSRTLRRSYKASIKLPKTNFTYVLEYHLICLQLEFQTESACATWLNTSSRFQDKIVFRVAGSTKSF